MRGPDVLLQAYISHLELHGNVHVFRNITYFVVSVATLAKKINKIFLEIDQIWQIALSMHYFVLLFYSFHLFNQRNLVLVFR